MDCLAPDELRSRLSVPLCLVPPSTSRRIRRALQSCDLLEVRGDFAVSKSFDIVQQNHISFRSRETAYRSRQDCAFRRKEQVQPRKVLCNPTGSGFTSPKDLREASCGNAFPKD